MKIASVVLLKETLRARKCPRVHIVDLPLVHDDRRTAALLPEAHSFPKAPPSF